MANGTASTRPMISDRNTSWTVTVKPFAVVGEGLQGEDGVVGQQPLDPGRERFHQLLSPKPTS